MAETHGEEMDLDHTPKGQNADVADAEAELQFESPSPASEGEEADNEEEDDVMPPLQTTPDARSEAHEDSADPPEPLEIREQTAELEEAMEEPLPVKETETELKPPNGDNLPDVSKEVQGPVVPRLRNFFRRHAEDGRAHNPSKIERNGVIPAGKEISPRKEVPCMDDAPEHEVVKQTEEQPAEPTESAEPTEPAELAELAEPAERTEPAEPAEKLAEETEHTEQTELTEQTEQTEQTQDPTEELAEKQGVEEPEAVHVGNVNVEKGPDELEAQPDSTDLEESAVPPADSNVEGEASSPLTQEVQGASESVEQEAAPAEASRNGRSSGPEKRSKSAGPFLAEMPEHRELARRVWRASAVPRAGGRPREVVTHVPQARGTQRRDDNRKFLRGKNGPRSVSPRPDQASSRRAPFAGKGKQTDREEKEPRIWKARNFQPEVATTKMPFTKPPPPPPIELLPEVAWKAQKAPGPERVRVH